MPKSSDIYDVLIIGSGAAGATAALRAAELGLSVMIIEKAPKFGGTSATSGGVMWIPNHGLTSSGKADEDSREETFRYLDQILPAGVRRDRLEVYVDQGREMLAFLRRSGVALDVSTWPDYFPEAAGARSDRAIVAPTFDGRILGDKFALMREQYPRFKLLNRYAMDVIETFTILARGAGWKRTVAKVILRYWADISTRRISHRDRRFTMGNALMGRLYEQIFKRGVALQLDTALEDICVEDGRVVGVSVRHLGHKKKVAGKAGRGDLRGRL